MTNEDGLTSRLIVVGAIVGCGLIMSAYLRRHPERRRKYLEWEHGSTPGARITRWIEVVVVVTYLIFCIVLGTSRCH
jgi:hypothetical protein